MIRNSNRLNGGFHHPWGFTSYFEKDPVIQKSIRLVKYLAEEPFILTTGRNKKIYGEYIEGIADKIKTRTMNEEEYDYILDTSLDYLASISLNPYLSEIKAKLKKTA